MHPFIETQKEWLRSDVPPFRPGDTLRVNVRVKEGDKERLQAFEGVCIARRGSGVSERVRRESSTRSCTMGPCSGRPSSLNVARSCTGTDLPFVTSCHVTPHAQLLVTRLAVEWPVLSNLCGIRP